MSADDFNSFNNMDEQHFAKMIKKPHSGIAEKEAAKKAINEAALAKMFKRASGNVPTVQVLNEAEKPIIRTIPVENVPKPPSPLTVAGVNKEHEPESVPWRPTTVPEIISLYPQASAVSDLSMCLHNALQQPGFAVGLVGPNGTKLLIRADAAGNFQLANPGTNGAAFFNIGLNPDMDKDDDEDGGKHEIDAAAKPAQQNSHRILSPGKVELNNHVKYAGVTEEFDISEEFEINEAKYIPTEDIPDQKTRSVVEKLRNMAADLRAGKKTALTESREPNVTVRQLSNGLYKLQEMINKTGNQGYEVLADELTEVIAEALLANQNAVPVSSLTENLKKLSWL